MIGSQERSIESPGTHAVGNEGHTFPEYGWVCVCKLFKCRKAGYMEGRQASAQWEGPCFLQSMAPPVPAGEAEVRQLLTVLCASRQS